MRIQIIVDCYLPSTRSSAKLVSDLALEFRRLGHQVCIATPDDSLSANVRVDAEPHCTVVRVKSGRIKGANRIRRAIAEARLPATIWKHAQAFFRANRCDLIVFYSPSIFFGALVARLKRLWNCPAYLVLRDIFPQWALDTGELRRGPAYWYFRRKELLQYAAADVIGVQSAANLDYFRRQAIEPLGRLEVLYNWTAIQENDVPKTHFRQRLGLAGKLIFFYGGNIGVAQDMDNVLRLAANLRHEGDLHFLLTGDGSEVPRLNAQIAARKLTNVSLHPAVDQREYLGILSEIDVGLVSLDRRLRTQNFPGKILGYMSRARPILASINPGNDLRDLLEQHHAGLVCLNGDDRQLCAAALRLARSHALRERLGENGRTLLARNFSVNGAARQILANFQAARPNESTSSTAGKGRTAA